MSCKRHNHDKCLRLYFFSQKKYIPNISELMLSPRYCHSLNIDNPYVTTDTFVDPTISCTNLDIPQAWGSL